MKKISISPGSVYIIIPVYNRKEITLNCLKRLDSFNYLRKYKVVVVDDGSIDGTAEAIQTLYPDVTVLTGNGDLWWTGGMVMGMEHALKAGAEFIVWMNDDCLATENTLPIMVNFANENPKTIVGPSCFYLKDSVWTQKNSGSVGRKRFYGERCSVKYVDALAGWCVLIPTTVIKAIGLPDMKRFPHYEADNMYILKATRTGFKACILGDAEVKVIGELGEKHPRRDFSRYFGRGLSPQETLSSLFFSKKSPYRLYSQFFYHVERHGYPLGTLFFSIKSIGWLLKWTRLQILSQIKSSPLET